MTYHARFVWQMRGPLFICYQVKHIQEFHRCTLQIHISSTVTLPKSTVARRFMSKTLENRQFSVFKSSVKRRTMVAPWSAGLLRKFTPWYRPKVARSSSVNQRTIGRRSVDDSLSKTRRQTDAGYRRHSADNRPTVRRSFALVCVALLIMHVSTLFMKLNHSCMLFCYSLHWNLVQILCDFCVGFLVELFVWRFEINVINSPKKNVT